MGFAWGYGSRVVSSTIRQCVVISSWVLLGQPAGVWWDAVVSRISLASSKVGFFFFFCTLHSGLGFAVVSSVEATGIATYPLLRPVAAPVVGASCSLR